MLSRTWDYYAFFYYFLQPMLLVLSQWLQQRFSPEGLDMMKNHQTLIDYFMVVDFNFIKCHGFSEEPFKLLKFIIERTLALEECFQATIIDNSYGVKRHK